MKVPDRIRSSGDSHESEQENHQLTGESTQGAAFDELREKVRGNDPGSRLYLEHQRLQELGKKHQARVLAMIKEGRGVIVQESEFSFSGKDDPDVLLGGH
ncbi:MAG: hypothetical protein R3E96_00890 [Planctomycetota bacterium]